MCCPVGAGCRWCEAESQRVSVVLFSSLSGHGRVRPWRRCVPTNVRLHGQVPGLLMPRHQRVSAHSAEAWALLLLSFCVYCRILVACGPGRRCPPPPMPLSDDLHYAGWYLRCAVLVFHACLLRAVGCKVGGFEKRYRFSVIAVETCPTAYFAGLLQGATKSYRATISDLR